MSHLQVQQVDLKYGAQSILSQISFDLHAGGIGCLLGASGCGKTSLLRVLAGLVRLERGQVLLGERVLSDERVHLPTNQRDIGMMFQDFALFPHLSVTENIAFGLQTWSRSDRDQRVEKMLALMELQSMAQRLPHELSGGQQQRVALARSIAPKPSLLLLDEPFSNQDRERRLQLADTCCQLLRAERITCLMVTHDQQEAFALADRVGMLHLGALQQWDLGYNLYHRPDNRIVAQFIGEGIFLPVTINTEGELVTPLGVVGAKNMLPINAAASGVLSLLVRPDDILHDDDSPWQAEVIARAFRGAECFYTLRLDNRVDVPCLAPSHHDHKIGERIGIKLQMDHQVIFDGEQALVN